MTIFWIIGLLLFVIIVGGYSTNKEYKKIATKNKFANDYLDKYKDFIDSHYSSNFNSDCYEWLTKNASKIQSLLGRSGIGAFRAPFGLYTMNNYQIIVNTIPKFRNGPISREEVYWVEDAILRYVGVIEEMINKQKKYRFNPFVWLRVGIQQILSVPLIILDWIGVFSTSQVQKIRGSKGYSIFSGLISLIALTSGVISIIVGWDRFAELVSGIFPH